MIDISLNGAHIAADTSTLQALLLIQGYQLE